MSMSSMSCIKNLWKIPIGKRARRTRARLRVASLCAAPRIRPVRTRCFPMGIFHKFLIQLIGVFCIGLLVLPAFAQENKLVKFPVRNIFFQTRKVSLRVQMAETPEQRAHGLMFRKELSDSLGMLFVSAEEEYQSFWMKNTLIPLSIGFFNKDKVLLEVLDMQPALGPVEDAQLPNYRSRSRALYALEVAQGWFRRKKINVGDKFIFKK